MDALRGLTGVPRVDGVDVPAQVEDLAGGNLDVCGLPLKSAGGLVDEDATVGDVLGMWFQRIEGAKLWLSVLTELKARGLTDVLVCCVDGLTGFPQAIEAIFPETWVQTCLVHQVRSSMRFVPYKDRRAIASDLKTIYTAVDRDHAEGELERFAARSTTTGRETLGLVNGSPSTAGW